MAEKKEYVKLWLSYASYFEAYSAAEVGRLVLAMMKYRASGAEPEFSGSERFIWPAIKRDIDESISAQEAIASANRENGKRGGRPKGHKPDGFLENPKNPMGFLESEKNHGQRSKDKGQGNGQGEGKGVSPTTPSLRGGATSNYLGFDRFWAAYPKKSAKADAFEAWKRVDPDEALVKRILEAVKMQKLWPQYSGENRRFFPTPAKWLDGGCWDDEPTEGEEDPYAKFT